MKMLLTSAGITNQPIRDALLDLLGKDFSASSIVCIPTASNVERGDKGWLIDNYRQLQELKFKQLEIADISALPESLWKPRLEEADIIFVGGGNTFHLMNWMNKSGVSKILPALLETRIYVGVSAGSMVTNPDLALEVSQLVYDEDFDQQQNLAGLGFVDFYTLPHLNSEYFPKMKEPYIAAARSKLQHKVYALDDNSAIKVDGTRVEVVSTGQVLEFN